MGGFLVLNLWYNVVSGDALRKRMIIRNLEGGQWT